MPTIQVGGWAYPSFNSTNGIAVDLFLAGCARTPKCVGCYNPYLWDFTFGKEEKIKDVISQLKYRYKDADNIALLGGEPLNQPNINLLLAEIKLNFPGKSLWVYTSYELSEVSEVLFPFIDYIKTGRFDRQQPVKGWLSSANQVIWKKVVAETGEFTFQSYYKPLQ